MPSSTSSSSSSSSSSSRDSSPAAKRSPSPVRHASPPRHASPSPPPRRRSPSPPDRSAQIRARREHRPSPPETRRDDRRRASPDRRRRASPPPRKRSPPVEDEEKKKKGSSFPFLFIPLPEPLDLLRSRAGGAYIPPAKLKLMQEQLVDKDGEQYQRMNWERLKKRIHGQVNKVNVGNLVSVVRELLQENIIRGKGLLARSIIQAQAFSPTFSHVYAALVAVINSKFPHIGELILRRLIVQFKRSFRRNDKNNTITLSKFIAHLINQQVAHEVLALEVMILLLETPTDDSVEVTIAFLKECGAKLSEVSPRGVNSIFDRLRSILNDADIDKRVQYTIEVIFHVRKDKFQAYPSVISELDLIDEEDQITHTITLEDAQDPENQLNVFKFDPDFAKNEAIYEEIRQEIIGDAGSSSDEDGDDDAGDEDADEAGAAGAASQQIVDSTEQSLVAFRRIVYLTIQSSLDYQEAAHKLLKMELKPGMEAELCNMIVDCCAQQRTYEKFYGLLAERFCRLRKEFQDCFERTARDTYNTIHRFEITKLRNMARLIAHLLFTDAISWEVLSEIRLNEDDTTSSGRIYIKTVFLELVEFLGLVKLYERIRDPLMQVAFDKIFPRDNPRDTRFAINFFTSIGLGGLTIDLREHLKTSGGLQKPLKDEVSSSSSSDSSSDDSSSTTSSSDSDDSDGDDHPPPVAANRDLDKENANRNRFQQRVKQEPMSPRRAASPPRRRQEQMSPPLRRRRSPPQRRDEREPRRTSGSPPAKRQQRRPSPPVRRRSPSPRRRSPSPRRRSPSPRRRSPSPPRRRAHSPVAERRRRSRSPEERSEKRGRNRET